MPASPARFVQGGLTHCIECDFTFADSGVAKEIGTIPAGSTMIRPISGANVNVAFNAGTNNFINIGTADNDDLYATNLAGGTIAFVPFDEAVAQTVTEDTTLYVTYVQSGTAATAGAGVAVVNYIPPSS